MPSRTCNSRDCSNQPTFCCAEGHSLCLWHTFRILGGFRRRCVLCMDDGKFSVAERRV
jgi:hypothetical protein